MSNEVNEKTVIDDIYAYCSVFHGPTLHASIFRCLAICPTKAVWEVIPEDIQKKILKDIQTWILYGRSPEVFAQTEVFFQYQVIELFFKKHKLL